MEDLPTPTGGPPADDLISVLRLVCSALPADEISARLGPVRPPAEPGEPARIEPTRYPSLRAIDFLPWTDDDFGVVELLLADPDEWRVSELEAILGPFRAVTETDSGARSLAADFEDPSLPAWAAVYINLGRSPSGDERVESITIRTEPPELEDD
jgi:hypothetical protein